MGLVETFMPEEKVEVTLSAKKILKSGKLL